MMFLSLCKVCNVAQTIFFIFERLEVEVIRRPFKFYLTAMKICLENENEVKKGNRSCIEHISTVIIQRSLQCQILELFFRK
jgi:hypothetical protein